MDAKNETPEPTEDDALAGRYRDLRIRITRHCKLMRQLDPDYATYAYNHYREELPWLELKAPKQ